MSGLHDTFDGPAVLGGRDLVYPTEQFPRSKDGPGLEFVSGDFTSGLRGLGDTNTRCAVLGHHSLVPALPGSIRGETPERAYVAGSLVSGRTGEFDDYSRFRTIKVLRL